MGKMLRRMETKVDRISSDISYLKDRAEQNSSNFETDQTFEEDFEELALQYEQLDLLKKQSSQVTSLFD